MVIASYLKSSGALWGLATIARRRAGHTRVHFCHDLQPSERSGFHYNGEFPQVLAKRLVSGVTRLAQSDAGYSDMCRDPLTMTVAPARGLDQLYPWCGVTSDGAQFSWTLGGPT